MIVRIFLPESFYQLKRIDSSECYYIFGHICCDNIGENVSIYIIDIQKASVQKKSSRQLIGKISKSPSDFIELIDDYIAFGINETKSALELNAIRLPNFIQGDGPFKTQIFLYDLKAFSSLSLRNDTSKVSFNSDPISKLLFLIRSGCEDTQKQMIHQRFNTYHGRVISTLMSLSIFTQVNLSFLHSSFLNHFHFWTNNLKKTQHKNILTWTIAFDLIAGIVVMLWLWRLPNADEYLLKLTMFIVNQLQRLLDALKGSPVGLKLNMDLNHFFLECFRYHVDLWAAFLVVIAPLVKYLFVPLTIIGCFGLSFQLSMLVDLLKIITLHAHCIYTYSSIIHQIEINGLIGAWRVVSGRRKNILKDRIESYEYTNQQLYLSTIFFSALLFLLPTNLIYYIVFASLQFALNCITLLLTSAQRKLLSLPVFYIAKWVVGQHPSSDNFEVVLLEDVRNSSLDTECLSLFSIKTVRSSFPSWIAA